MSTLFVLNTELAVVAGLVKQVNALHDALAVADGYSSNHFHRDISGIDTTQDFANPTSVALQVTAPTPSDLASVIALANNLKGVLLVHMADDSAHLISDTVNHAALLAVPDAKDLASVELLLNEMRGFYEAHRVQAGVHVANDTVNHWFGANATDLASASALANFGKGVVNDHINSAPSIGRIKILP